jgi:hypothetical protein
MDDLISATMPRTKQIVHEKLGYPPIKKIKKRKKKEKKGGLICIGVID